MTVTTHLKMPLGTCSKHQGIWPPKVLGTLPSFQGSWLFLKARTKTYHKKRSKPKQLDLTFFVLVQLGSLLKGPLRCPFAVGLPRPQRWTAPSPKL